MLAFIDMYGYISYITYPKPVNLSRYICLGLIGIGRKSMTRIRSHRFALFLADLEIMLVENILKTVSADRESQACGLPNGG